MRRISLIVTIALACVAGVTLIPGAVAGDFSKEGPCTGDDPLVCPTATVGQSYSTRFLLKEPKDACPDIRVSSGEFPPGLTLSTDEGIASGTPTRAGSYTFYVTVTYKCGTGGKGPGIHSDQRYTINVNAGVAAKPKLTITTTSLPDAGINAAYTAPALTASGGTVSSWTLAGGALPPGLTLASSGVISGTPTQSGTFTFTVQANGASVLPDTHQLSIFVAAPLALQTLVNRTPPETGLTAKRLVGATLKTGVKAVGGRPPYTFTATGSLPPGLTLDSATGLISGAGTAAGRYPFTVTVTDGTGAKVSVEWDITILPLLDFAKGKGLPVGKVGKTYSVRVPVRGKDAAKAQFAVAGEIPPGLEVDESGLLTGTLLQPGVYRLRVFAFPENGAPISKVFRVRVRG